MRDVQPIEEMNPDLLNPKRLAIMTILYVSGPKIEGDLMNALKISWGDLDSKLRRLREKGYIGSRKILTLKGPRTLVSITRRGISEYRELVERLRQLPRLSRRNSIARSEESEPEKNH